MVKVIRNMLKDIVDQSWTLLGMFIAWIVLDGSAKQIVGYGIVATFTLWMLTSPIRHRGEE